MPDLPDCSELIDEEFAPLNWLLDGLIPEGTILVAGKPKSGKSWFVLNLLVANAYERVFLDRTPKAYGSLYLALEDNPRRMQQRLRILLAGVSDRTPLKRIQYRCEWPKGQAGAAALDAYLTARPTCRIVAIDVLKNIRSGEDSRRNGYELDYEAIEIWRRVATRHGIILILVHHTRKQPGEDPFDEISGTLGINGSVDQMIVLKRAKGGETATLHMRGRDLPDDHEIDIQLIDGWWSTNSSSGRSIGRQRVLDLLVANPLGMPTRDIQDALGRQSYSSLYKLLVRMADDGELSRTGSTWFPV